MIIKSPRTVPSHRGYAAECETAMDLALAEVIDGAVQAGWSSTVIYDALEMLIIKHRLAYRFKPDLDDEPAWPFGT